VDGLAEADDRGLAEHRLQRLEVGLGEARVGALQLPDARQHRVADGRLGPGGLEGQVEFVFLGRQGKRRKG
jgi:hypothetical protein